MKLISAQEEAYFRARDRRTRAFFAMPTPVISICIPAYKAEKYLEAALASVHAQVFTDWELIVTEDGSRDRTEAIVQAFARSVPQPVLYNRHERNQGLPATRKTGIQAARGTWIAFLDADDLWRPDHLSALLQAAEGGPCDIAYAGCSIFDDATGQEIEQRVADEEMLRTFPVSLFLSQLIIQPSAAMVRRERVAEYGGFSAAYPVCNDLEFWLRSARHGAVFRYSGIISCRYRKHPQAMSQKAAALIAETAAICHAFRDWSAIPAEIRRQHPAALYRNAGRILLRQQPRDARALFGRAWRQRKSSLPTLGYWFTAWLLGLTRKSAT